MKRRGQARLNEYLATMRQRSIESNAHSALGRAGAAVMCVGVLLFAFVPGHVAPAEVHADPVEWIGQTQYSDSMHPNRFAASQALCDSLTIASGGEIEFVLHQAGEIVPAGTEHQAVEDGDLDFAIPGNPLGMPLEELFRFRMWGKSPEEKLDWYQNGDGSTFMQQWLDDEFTNLAFVPASGVMAPGEIFLHSDVPIDSLVDLEGLKVRVAGDAGIIFDRLGASPTYLPGSEIESAMDAGVIDAFEYSTACLNWQTGCQDWAEYVYLSDCRWPHDFSPLMVSKSLWNGLDQSMRDDLADAGSQTTLAECGDLISQNEACLQQFRDYGGCEVFDLPESVEQRFWRESYLYHREQADTEGALYDEVHKSLLRFGLPTDAWIGQASGVVGDEERFALVEELCAEVTAASGGNATFTLLPSWTVCPTSLEGQAVEDGILDFALSSINGLEQDLRAINLFALYMGGMSPQAKLSWYRDGDGTSLLEQGLDDNFDNVSFIPASGIMGPGEVFLHSRVWLDSPHDWYGLDIRAAGDLGVVHSLMGADAQFLRHPDEIYQALEDDRISAFEYGGYCGNWSVGCQDWAEYVYDSNCGAAHDFAPFLVRTPLWESLDATTRNDITDAAKEATLEHANSLADQEEGCMQAFIDYQGCQVYDLARVAPSVELEFLQQVRQHYRDEIVHHGAFYEDVVQSLESVAPLGIFLDVSGGVTSTATGSPSVGDKVYAGTEIETDATGTAELSMVMDEGECTLNLNPDSQIKVSEDPADELGTIEFYQGQLLVDVNDLPPEGFEVQTPHATAASTGTQWIVSGDADESAITVLDGSVEVSTPDGSDTTTVDEGYQVSASSSGLNTPSQTTYEDVILELDPGWNMVSIPVEHPFSMSVDYLLGDAEAVYTWDPDSKSYTTPTTIDPKKGYWVAVADDMTVTVTGDPFSEWTDDMTAGWNMIGSIHGGNADFTDPVDTPDGSMENFVYWWNPSSKSYVYGTSIEPGKGYWVAATQDCELTMTGTP